MHGMLRFLQHENAETKRFWTFIDVNAYYVNNNSLIEVRRIFAIENELKTTGLSVKILKKIYCLGYLEEFLATERVFKNFAILLRHIAAIVGKSSLKYCKLNRNIYS